MPGFLRDALPRPRAVLVLVTTVCSWATWTAWCGTAARTSSSLQAGWPRAARPVVRHQRCQIGAAAVRVLERAAAKSAEFEDARWPKFVPSLGSGGSGRRWSCCRPRGSGGDFRRGRGRRGPFRRRVRPSERDVASVERDALKYLKPTTGRTQKKQTVGGEALRFGPEPTLVTTDARLRTGEKNGAASDFSSHFPRRSFLSDLSERLATVRVAAGGGLETRAPPRGRRRRTPARPGTC